MPIEPRIVFALRAAADVDIHAIGLQVTKGDLILISFFEAASRRFSDEFYRRRNAMPSQIQAGVYSAVRHYL